jgi:phosphoribosylglycinamide formyltransferase-1
VINRVAIFVSGGGSNMKALVADMQGNHPARVCVVVSNNEDAGGIAWARAQGIATEVVDHRPYGDDRASFEAELTTALNRHGPDMICLAGFMRVLTAGFVTPWHGKMINIHPSLLPKYKGLHTHARALNAGDKIHGCTVHEVTALLDDGPILGQSKIDVVRGDTPDTLATRILVQEHKLYPAVLRRYCVGITSVLHL